MTRGYDDAGRMTSVQDRLSDTTSFGYDVNSNLTTETLPAASGVIDTFTFDAADRLMAIADKKGNSSLFAATYTRDNANQLTSDSSQPSSTKAYKYTTLNQVCYAGSASTTACTSPPSGSIPYKYDAADNLTQTGTTQQVFNNADELCWTGSTTGNCATPPTGATTYSYDPRGNRIAVTPPSGAATILSYDQANRLTAYGTTSTYAYNGDGLRMSKTVNGATSQILWDPTPSVPLLIEDGSGAYIYGPGGIALEQVNGSTELWYHRDQLGSTRLVTNLSGLAVAGYTFDAYGNLTAITGTIANQIRFAGQYQDVESSLYYMRSRYYDAATGNFLSWDPASPRTVEPYGYIRDSPLNGTDPTGLFDLLGALKEKAHQALEIASVTNYAVYYVAYRTDSSISQAANSLPGPLNYTAQLALAPTHLGLAAMQLLGMADDIEIDAVKHFVGGEPQINDEGINRPEGPFGSLSVTYLPGWHTKNACQMDFSWNHPFPWSRGLGPIPEGQRP